MVVKSPVNPAGLVDTVKVAYPAGTESLSAAQVLAAKISNSEIVLAEIFPVLCSMVVKNGLIRAVLLYALLL